MVLQKNLGCWTGGVVCKKTVDGVAKNFGREKTGLNLLHTVESTAFPLASNKMSSWHKMVLDGVGGGGVGRDGVAGLVL